MTTDLIKFPSRRVTCSHHVDDHIYIGYNDGSIIQIDLNMNVLYSGETHIGSIYTIFHHTNKLIICGTLDRILLYEISYPLVVKMTFLSGQTPICSATFGDVSIYSSHDGIVLVKSVNMILGRLEYDKHLYVDYTPLRLCINEDTIAFVYNCIGIYKADHGLEKNVCINDENNGEITLRDGEDEVHVEIQLVLSLCIWRGIVVSSSILVTPSNFHHPSSIFNQAIIRWKLGAIGIYEPELFLKRCPVSIQIMGDQLFELDEYVVNCWNWDKVHLRTFDFSSDYDGKRTIPSLVFKGNIFMFNGNGTVCNRTGNIN